MVHTSVIILVVKKQFVTSVVLSLDMLPYDYEYDALVGQTYMLKICERIQMRARGGKDYELEPK